MTRSRRRETQTDWIHQPAFTRRRRARLASLYVAAVAGGVAFLIIPLIDVFSNGRFPTSGFLVPLLPAVVFGLSELSRRSALKQAAPLVIASIVMTLSLIWASEGTRVEGVVTIATFVSCLPLWALVMSLGQLDLVQRVFVHATVAAVIFGTLLSVINAGVSALNHIGIVMGPGLVPLTNKNQVAAQLAVGAILAIHQYMKPETGAQQRGRFRLMFIWGILLAILTILTQSRAQTLALGIGLLVLVVALPGPRRRQIRLLTGLLLAFAGTAAVSFAFLATSPLDTYERFIQAFSGSDVSLNERILILEYALNSLIEPDGSGLLGSGVGSVQQALASAVEPPGGFYRPRLSSHNTVAELIISLGVVGLLLGAWIIAWSWRGLVRNDVSNRDTIGRSLGVVLTASGLAVVLFLQPYWPIVGAITISLITRQEGVSLRSEKRRQILQGAWQP